MQNGTAKIFSFLFAVPFLMGYIFYFLGMAVCFAACT